MGKVSIVIPCYNSEKTIGMVVDEVVSEMKQLHYDFEVILVCDGLWPRLWDVIRELSDKYYPIVKGIRFAKNFGQHSALMAGYRESIGDVVIQLDDDGQCTPKGIKILLNKIEEGYDVVFANYPESKKSWFRKWGSEVNRKMCISLVGMPKNIHANSFSAMRRYVVDEMIRYDKPYPYVGGLMFRATSNMCDVQIEHHERTEGESGYNLRKLIKLWLNGFTAFSVKPLEAASVTGFIIALIGLIFALFVIVRKLCGYSVLAGWSSVIALILIVGGINLIMLGLVGEYIGRIYLSINNMPQYVIKDIYEGRGEK